MTPNSGVIGAVILLVAAGLSLWDLETDAKSTLVVYTTPALRNVLEDYVVPAFQRATDIRVSLVFVSAGQEYNRLRMAGESPEGDVILQASPLYLEKGYAAGHVDAFMLADDARVPEHLKARAEGAGRAWYAFAWSPLVQVRATSGEPSQDLATTNATFGFPHPLLSNNGVYGVLLFEESSPAAGRNALAHTRVQPTNARANVGGVADGSFALTLGYEAVVEYYQGQGARIASEIPLVNGERVTTPVLASAGIIHNGKTPQARLFIDFLFSNETQSALREFSFRSIAEPTSDPQARVIHYDWSQWERLEAALPYYEVKK